jgi:LacI family transcriptional regulator
MTHLIAHGHKRIAFVGQAVDSTLTPLSTYVEAERFGAYRDALLEIGSFDDRLVKFGRAYSIEEMDARRVPLGDGYAALQAWLAAGLKPTAIVASSDILAAGVLQAAYGAGLAVPRDLSVIGFDDTLATFLSPLLTSVGLPSYDIGLAAARLALSHLAHEGPREPIIESLQARLIERASVGPAANH